MVDRTRTRREFCAFVGAALSLSLAGCFNPPASDTSDTTAAADTSDTPGSADPTGDPTSEPTGSDTSSPQTTTTVPTSGSECDCPDSTPICHEDLEICVGNA